MEFKNYLITVSFFLCLCEVAGQVPFVCQGQSYLCVSGSNASQTDLFLVDINPVTQEVAFNPLATAIGANMNGIGYRSTDNLIYGVNPSPLHMSLYRIGADGVAQDLGFPQGLVLLGNYYYAGDVTPDGAYLVLLGQGDFDAPEGILAFVDLDHPNYQVTNVPLVDYFDGIYDIAFDPYSGELYGFSSENAHLVKINPETGTIFGDYEVQPQVSQIGALFFDVSGNLFGYGSVDGEKTLLSINKETGVVESVGLGPLASTEDGCSCPYTIDLKKSVSADRALPCSEVIFTFEIINGTSLTQPGLTLSDIMPEDFTILEILSNPFGGNLTVSDHAFEIQNLSIPSGSDSIRVLVEISEDAMGGYKNQAVLTGLPASLGDVAVSDNPNTLTAEDSTAVFVETIDLSFIEEEYIICPGDNVVIDLSFNGATYQWENGSQSPVRALIEPGTYSATVTSECQQEITSFEVITELVYTYYQEQYILCEGEQLEIDVSSYGSLYAWENEEGMANRIFNEVGTYSVTVSEACDISIIEYEVLSEGFHLNIIPEHINLDLGEFTSFDVDYWHGDEMVSFQWTDPLGNSLSCLNCPSAVATPKFDVLYTLTMSVEDGCVYEDEVFIHVKKDRAVYIPNIISPNDDGINDYFYVQSKGHNVKIKSMKIFDRWGDLIFENKNLSVNSSNQGWDGTRNGDPVGTGVYVYLIEFEFPDGFVRVKSGDVMVLR